MFDGPINWPNVLVLAGFQAVFVAVLIATKFWVVKRAMRSGIGEAVTAIKEHTDGVMVRVTKQQDDTYTLLLAIKEHTAQQTDWEKRRQEEHERKDREYTEKTRQIVRDEIGKQLKLSEKVVVSEVKQVPDATIEAMKSADTDSGIRRLNLPGTGDSHHG